ncbi:pyrroloquinoline quinone biosynthesis peptide chaperone PqqD [Poseidonibacter lekithochrous]|uniref:pyrroloquinoline quinone biosynthesis peptide chaperone PqqD n=1 Tax=Poseidonibacter lekithochrous TaxID=1904463 RepID=UPI0008FC6A05|nr:pyrroloquinoline quinone biosynthesis peptide chaperone PqqD [Poseidonibacter lekithochrous]QKJ21920.1 PqqA peptide chaperone [Poseidonibacter lekithochrous]
MQLEKSLVINNHFQLQWEEKQDCFVLLYPEGMVQLSQSAGEILNLCDGKNNTQNIAALLEEKFNTSELLNDIIEFLEDAMSRKWVLYNE